MRSLLSDSRAMPFPGDLTQGAASTGPVLSHSSDAAAGFVCVIEADSSGRAEFLNAALNSNLQVCWLQTHAVDWPRSRFLLARRFGT